MVKRWLSALIPEHTPTDDPSLYYKSDDLDRALEYLEKAIKIAPESALLRYHLAKVQIEKGNTKSAKLNLKKVIDSKAEFHGRDDAKLVFESI